MLQTGLPNIYINAQLGMYTFKGYLPNGTFQPQCTRKTKMKDEEGVMWDFRNSNVSANDKQ